MSKKVGYQPQSEIDPLQNFGIQLAEKLLAEEETEFLESIEKVILRFKMEVI